MAAAAEGEEDPRWRRCNTDCVYFLASPFTCTKGSKCEYRHADGARFNRRNCWYWFKGNCVNPSCTFRHPPLENLNKTKSLADPLSLCSTSVKAANPCYFYYNLHCSKGDNCPYLHEPLTSNDAVGTSCKATTSNPAVSKSYVGDEMVEESKDTITNPCQDTSCHIKEVPVSINPEFGEAEAVSGALETSTDIDEYMKCSAVSDLNSGDSTMDHTEQDERDSSPGFDVLVDDCLSNKSDLEHQLTTESDNKVLHAEYGIRDPVLYDMYYHDPEYYNYEPEFCGLDDRQGYLYLCQPNGAHEHESEITLGHLLPQNTEVTSDEFDRRFFNPRNFTSSVADTNFVHQHTQIRHISKRRPENRKGAKGKKDCIKRSRCLEPKNSTQQIESMPTRQRKDYLMGECPQPANHATFRGRRKKNRGKQQHVLSAKSSEHPTADFTGPKTLAQIKEEKCKSNSSFSHSTACTPNVRSFSDDFEGPKSLTELLMTKSRSSVGK
ncbi:zinc finger CCCH domain-containing protein 34 [Oryza glaberrima]|uniref:C3H1-type domain-containing protein n=2 Tax=Oryza TaxID=4527 RepID=A0A0D3G3U0_9ORYZ|nr:zinc finger CCCH domain-containing protein 34 [Oryza glaberrima]